MDLHGDHTALPMPAHTARVSWPSPRNVSQPHDGLPETAAIIDHTANARTGQHLSAHERQPAPSDHWGIGYG